MASASTAGRKAEPEGGGWLVFAGIMVMLVGILNTIYGIAAIDKAAFFLADQKYIVSDLSTWGWITLAIGIGQLFAAFSLWSGNVYGRIVGIVMAIASSIAALLSIPAYPFWSLAVFTIDILIIYGLASYDADRRSTPRGVAT